MTKTSRLYAAINQFARIVQQNEDESNQTTAGFNVEKAGIPVKSIKKATINLSGLGNIYVPSDIGDERNVYLCGAMTKGGMPVNTTTHRASVAKTNYASADEAEAAGYYLREVAPHIFMLVSPDAE